jgi:hypothetical protein
MSVEEQVLEKQGYIICATERPEAFTIGKSVTLRMAHFDQEIHEDGPLFVLREATRDEYVKQALEQGIPEDEAIWDIAPETKFFALTAE